MVIFRKKNWYIKTQNPPKRVCVTSCKPVKTCWAVRWRLNGRGYWRSFARLRGANGADAFYALLKVAAVNERQWDSVTGLPPSVIIVDDVNVADFCRSYMQDEWRRLSPSTRRSYVEALSSLILHSARPGSSAPREEWRTELTAWLTPNHVIVPPSMSGEWLWSEDLLSRNLQSWLKKNSQPPRCVSHLSEKHCCTSFQKSQATSMRQMWQLVQRLKIGYGEFSLD